MIIASRDGDSQSRDDFRPLLCRFFLTCLGLPRIKTF
jgi:hypothetical protein